MSYRFLFLLCMLLWGIPFIVRLCLPCNYTEIHPLEEMTSYEEQDDRQSKLTKSIKEGNNYNFFILIAENNLKGCVTNLVGGFIFSFPTVVNLVVNGFVHGDILVSTYNAGISSGKLAKITLPHSFELIGFWLSGVVGMKITELTIYYVGCKRRNYTNELKVLAELTILVIIIIIVAAFVEAYISASFIK